MKTRRQLSKSLFVTLISTLLFLSAIPVQADGIIKVETIVEEVAEKEKEDSVYIIEEANYRKIIQADSVMIEKKGGLLVVNSSKLTDSDLEEMSLKDSVYILGDLNENMDKIQELPNFRHNITEENMYELTPFIAKENKEKDIVIVNGDSISDFLTGTQLSIIDNKNILLVNDELDYSVKEFLRANGKDKSITFIEGESTIDQKIKNEILEVSGNERYVLEDVELTKKAGKEREMKRIDLPNVKLNPMSDSILDSVSLNLLLKHQRESNRYTYDKNKVVTINQLNDDKLIDILNDFGGSETLFINSKDKNETDYSLTLTYASPVDLLEEVDSSLEQLVFHHNVKERIMDDLIEENEVDEYRIELIEQAGYSYEDMKKEIEEAKKDRTIEAFIKSALSMEGWTYSQPRRMEHGYADCSSLVLKAMLNSGLTEDETNLTTWTIHLDDRFYEVPMDQIERGDILWYKGHMEIYLGGNTTFGAFREGVPAGYASNIQRFNKAYRINIQ